MNVQTDVKIHNRFDIVLQNIETNEIRRGYAENIVLDRMYTRLVNFSPYFSYIHFGNLYS